jgi:hypothetical protein
MWIRNVSGLLAIAVGLLLPAARSVYSLTGDEFNDSHFAFSSD